MPKDMERLSNKFKTTALMLLSVMIMACAGNGKNGQGSESKKIEYRIVETASGAVGGNELWATKDGEFRNTEIEAAEFLEIIDQRDYDGDGLEEAFVCQSTGGSGHLPEFITGRDRQRIEPQIPLGHLTHVGDKPLDLIHETTAGIICQQLRYSDKTIKEICYKLNFPNLSFFGKFVKKHIGMSPTEFRQQNLKTGKV